MFDCAQIDGASRNTTITSAAYVSSPNTFKLSPCQAEITLAYPTRMQFITGLTAINSQQDPIHTYWVSHEDIHLPTDPNSYICSSSTSPSCYPITFSA